MLFSKTKMKFNCKLTDLERDTINLIVDAELPEYKLLQIADFIENRRHMTLYPGGHKKERKQGITTVAQDC